MCRLYGWLGSKLRGCVHIYILRVDCVVSACYYVDLRRVFARVLITFLRIFLSAEPRIKLRSSLFPTCVTTLFKQTNLHCIYNSESFDICRIKYSRFLRVRRHYLNGPICPCYESGTFDATVSIERTVDRKFSDRVISLAFYVQLQHFE